MSKLSTKLQVLPTSPEYWRESLLLGLLITLASKRCATGKAQQVCSIISTTPGGIKVLKGAVFIRVKHILKIGIVSITDRKYGH